MNELGLIAIYLGWFTLLLSFLTWVHGTKNMRTCCYQFFHPFKTLQTPKQRGILLVVLVSLLLGSIAVITRYERPRPAKNPTYWSTEAGTIVNVMSGDNPYTFYLRTTSGRVYATLITDEGAQRLIGQQAKEGRQLADGRTMLELSGGGALLVTRIKL